MSENLNSLTEEQRNQKIQHLRDMISTAESTIHSAKAMLLEIEGKKKLGRRKKLADNESGHIIYGTFNGQIMVGTDGKQYPVAANYASKSKLIEGDLLKLNITPDGAFIYKQIGPAPRKNSIGIVGQDSMGNYFVAVDGKSYKILLASITYFKVEPGDEVAVIMPQDENASWVTIDNVLKYNNSEEQVSEEVDKEAKQIFEEWTPTMDEIEKEIKSEINS